jgi:hypothetical protein
VFIIPPFDKLCRELLPFTTEFDAGSSRKPYSEFGIAPDKRFLFIQTVGKRSSGSGRVTNRQGAFPDGAVLETCVALKSSCEMRRLKFLIH